jgi:large subunit ribosomal protein L25
MNKFSIKAEKRTLLGSKVKQLRRKGILPANIFGKTVPSQAVQVNMVEFNRVYKQAGETGLVWVSIEGEDKERPTLITAVTKNPVSGLKFHVDFHQVNLKEKVSSHVPVEIIGEAQLIKDGLAVLDTHLDELEVEALPTDIPESIVFDISSLKEVGDHLSASSVALPAGITLLTDPEAIVVALGEPQKEEEPLVTEVAEVEVVGETKEPGTEAVEPAK